MRVHLDSHWAGRYSGRQWLLGALLPRARHPEKKSRTWIIAALILVSGGLLVAAADLMYLYRRRKMREMNLQDPKRKMSKVLGGKSIASLQIQHLQRENVENARGLDTERPAVFGLGEITEGTTNFDESRKIGEGGYGSVYYGILGEKEVAIKKMKSSKSKEFFAKNIIIAAGSIPFVPNGIEVDVKFLYNFYSLRQTHCRYSYSAVYNSEMPKA